MGLVKSNMALFTTPMETKDTLNKHYRVFKAQVDTIKAYGGNPGYHDAIYCEHYNVLTKNRRHNTKAKLDAVEDAEVKTMKAEALKSSAGAYLI